MATEMTGYYPAMHNENEEHNLEIGMPDTFK